MMVLINEKRKIHLKYIHYIHYTQYPISEVLAG